MRLEDTAFPLESVCSDGLIWGLSIDYLPTSVYQGEEGDCVPAKLCNVPELEWPCCGAEGREGERTKGTVSLPPRGVKNLGAGDWGAALWSSRDQGESWEFKYLEETV